MGAGSSSEGRVVQGVHRGGAVTSVHIRLCLKKVLPWQPDLQNWQNCRCVYDALARSSSSCLGLGDGKSGLEALALKQSLVDCGTMIRWCAGAPWELFVR